MAEPKAIYCPICKERVAKYDGRTTTDIVSRCGRCHKRIIYRVDTEEIEIKPIPPRTTSSGITYC